MTTTVTATRTHAVHHPRASQRLAIDPYRVEDTAWTRDEIMAARGGFAVPASSARRSRPSTTRRRHR